MSAYVKHDSLYTLPLLHHQPSFIACADDAAAVIRIHCRPIKTPLFLAAKQLIGHFAALPLLLLFFFFSDITLLLPELQQISCTSLPLSTAETDGRTDGHRTVI